MKRLVCILLILTLLLCGCRKDDKVKFYYCPADSLSGAQDSLFTSEVRTVTGYTDDLYFLISLYLSGPLDQDLVSPFPEGTELELIAADLPDITVQLKDLPQNMTDSEYSIACACLSMTVMELTDAESVTVVSGKRSVTMKASTLVLSDESTPTTVTVPGGTQ